MKNEYIPKKLGSPERRKLIQESAERIMPPYFPKAIDRLANTIKDDSCINTSKKYHASQITSSVCDEIFPL